MILASLPFVLAFTGISDDAFTKCTVCPCFFRDLRWFWQVDCLSLLFQGSQMMFLESLLFVLGLLGISDDFGKFTFFPPFSRDLWWFWQVYCLSLLFLGSLMIMASFRIVLTFPGISFEQNILVFYHLHNKPPYFVKLLLYIQIKLKI